MPLGKALVRREGKEVSLLAYGYMAHVCLEAAQNAAEKGVEAGAQVAKFPLGDFLASLGKSALAGGAAAEAAAKIGKVESVPFLKRAAQMDPVPAVQQKALELLYLIDQEEAMKVGSKLLEKYH